MAKYWLDDVWFVYSDAGLDHFFPRSSEWPWTKWRATARFVNKPQHGAGVNLWSHYSENSNANSPASSPPPLLSPYIYHPLCFCFLYFIGVNISTARLYLLATTRERRAWHLKILPWHSCHLVNVGLHSGEHRNGFHNGTRGKLSSWAEMCMYGNWFWSLGFVIAPRLTFYYRLGNIKFVGKHLSGI